eukprot:m.204766 g.204766  ORF g.204766 m.204766 type:complete len:62 (+) comp17088_c0_seq11:1821-2006(+)
MGIDKSIEREGHDRSDTALPGMQPTLVTKVLALNKPTILILSNEVVPVLLCYLLFSCAVMF